ncbi:MAG: DUF1553 domain-containing protein [Candidatus Omnitrophica bacterium]|nr:DUF1553 domain-containing protein [Candidatus Omnitrophota bacterium]
MKHDIMLAFGRDYNPFLYHTVDTMAVAVVEDASYQIEVLDPVVKVIRGGSAKIRVRAIRKPGFNESIALSAPWTPPGLACGSPTLPAGEDEIEIEIAASEGASPGVRKMLVVGDYLDYGIASAFFDLEVLSPEGNAGQVASVEVPPEQLMMSSPKVEPTPSGPIKSPPKDAESTEVLEEVTKESKVAIAATPTISFRHEILPLLTKFGCNTAACHGRKSESNPFYLSVFGHDAKNDYSTLLGDSSHPRIVPGHPDQSLLFLKTSGQISHEGGELLSPGSRPYRLVRTWIEEGAHPDPEGAPQIQSIEIRPKHVVLDGKGVTRRFTLLATFSDGQSREVSDLGTFTASDPLRLNFDESGLATAGESGEVTVLGRYGRLSACAQVIVRPDYRELDWPDLPVANYIDQRVFEKLRLLRLVPASLCEDHVFLRRAYLDIIGVLPTVEETQCFLEDPDPNKRARLVDELLERPEFADVWATKWADVLHVRSFDAIDRKAMIRYSEWIQNSMKAGATPAKLTADILAAEGGAFTSPATNFYKPFTPSEEIAEDFAQVFLGIRIQCAKCHDHPFDHWTMDDYYSFAAFFGRTYRKNSEDRRQALVYSDNSYGEVKHPKTHEAVAPKFLGGVRPQTEGLDRRAVLADWVVSGTNPWFARNVANRVWEHFFGAGLVSPVDDFRDSNPPTHPHLLEDLANRLVECDFDIKPLIRDIAGSTVYQLSCTPRDPDRNDVKNYSHYPIRRLDAEVLADSLSQVGEQAVKYPYYPLGYRAMELPNGRSEDHFLTAFGRPERETVCAEERQRQPTLSQGLALMNGQIVQQVCDRSRGRLNRLLVSDKGDSDIVSEIYMAAYCRPPSTDEVDRHVAYLAAAEDRGEAMEDILWAVLNSKEFLFQH